MSVSTLTLALSVFNQHNVRVVQVHKNHAQNYHLYYRQHNTNRVMMVPKECSDIVQLQSEVESLLGRDRETQQRIGHLDG
jgi:hypothetical protein